MEAGVLKLLPDALKAQEPLGRLGDSSGKP